MRPLILRRNLAAVLFGGFIALMVALAVRPAHALETRAEHAVLMDYETGIVFYEKNADNLMTPASMSKLMTLAVLFDRIKNGQLTLDDKFHVSEKAWRTGGSKMFVMVNTDIRVEDLIRGIIIDSGNDACIVVAEGISGTEEAFAREMTRFGREVLGFKKSTFANADGMPDPDHRMTALELAKLARYLIREYPDLYHYFSEKEFQWGKDPKGKDIVQSNRNPLLWADIGADGLKTGHTEESGYGLVASAVQDGRRLILVVNGLGSESERSTESQRLMRIGFRDYNLYRLFSANDVVGTADVWQGDKSRIPLTISEDLVAIMQPQDRDQMKVSVNYTGPITAPIVKGTPIGKLIVSAPNMPDIERPLYAAEAVKREGFFGRIGNGLIYWMGNQLKPPPSPGE